MGSSGSSSGSTKTTIRYADYIETKHKSFLDSVADARIDLIGVSTGSIMSKQAYLNYLYPGVFNIIPKLIAIADGSFEAAYAEYVASFSAQTIVEDSSPFKDYIDIDVDSAFFGAGYLISSFPSLYDMYGKFMAGLDIDALWTQIFEDTVNSSQVSELVSAEAALMDDEIETTSLPRLQTGMRDINAVIGSSFVIGKALIEDAKVKSLAKFSADLKYRLISVAANRWSTHLDWNKGVVGVYAEIMKFYFSAKSDIDEVNYAMAAKNKLWPFTVLDFERAALGALQGATNSKTDVAGASTASKMIGGALTGAAMGAMVGGSINQPVAAGAAAGSAGTYAGWGSVVGAGLGIAAALTY
jgi:hypothetical protein